MQEQSGPGHFLVLFPQPGSTRSCPSQPPWLCFACFFYRSSWTEVLTRQALHQTACSTAALASRLLASSVFSSSSSLLRWHPPPTNHPLRGLPLATPKKQDRPLEGPLLLVSPSAVLRGSQLGPWVPVLPEEGAVRTDQQGYWQVGHDSDNYDGVAPGCLDTDLGDQLGPHWPSIVLMNQGDTTP